MKLTCSNSIELEGANKPEFHTLGFGDADARSVLDSFRSKFRTKYSEVAVCEIGFVVAPSNRKISAHLSWPISKKTSRCHSVVIH